MPEAGIAGQQWHAAAELIGSMKNSSCQSIHGKAFGRRNECMFVPGRYREWPLQEGAGSLVRAGSTLDMGH